VRRLLKNGSALFGLAILGTIVMLALLAPWIGRFDPIKQNPRQSTRPPSAYHFFGTDRFGRDVWARTVAGGRLSLRTGIVAVAISMAIGFVPGLVAGYRGGWIDALIGRAVDIMLAFPGILLSLAIVAALGPGLFNVQLAIGISLSPTFVRLVRGCVLAASPTSTV
jgi:peptide/nickel transport system permease protein